MPGTTFRAIGRASDDLRRIAAACADSHDAERILLNAATLPASEFTVENVLGRMHEALVELNHRIARIEAILAAEPLAPSPNYPWAAPMFVRLSVARIMLRGYLEDPDDAFGLAS